MTSPDPTNKYFCRISIFPSGERFPVLLSVETCQPVVLPTRYVIDERRETKQTGTISRDIRVLGWFYERRFPRAEID
jgi:hypothetical protein